MNREQQNKEGEAMPTSCLWHRGCLEGQLSGTFGGLTLPWTLVGENAVQR